MRVSPATRRERDEQKRLAAGAFSAHAPGLSFIVGFWLIYALLTIANRAFDPGPPDRRPDIALDVVDHDFAR